MKLFQILRSRMYVAALLKGTASGVEHEVLLCTLDCKHIIDIGANCGQFALASRRCFPDARIDSFEPLNSPADRYEKVFAGDNNAILHRLAVGAAEGDATIHISNRDDSSSLLPITREQTTLFPGTDESHVDIIRVAPLSAVLHEDEIQSPALLKLDVQGYEMNALLGCKDLLEKISYIYCECSFVSLYEGQALAHEVVSFLETNDFVFSGIYNMTYHEGRSIQGDLFFIKQK